MGTQVPKALGIGVMVAGIPLILMDAYRTNDRLEALDSQSSSREGRVEACMTKTAHLNIAPKMQIDMCNCMVEKAEERGVTGAYGSYDEEGLDAVVKSCAWQLGL